MRTTRRHFLTGTAAAIGGITLLPYASRAAGHMGDMFSADGGDTTVHPVNHASFVMETPVGVIYSDPVGEPSAYSDLPPPNLILVTHEHGDHSNAETLAAIAGDDTRIIANPAVFGMLPEDVKAKASEIANGGSTTFNGLTIDAIPAYNTTEGRLNFHPEGRDNGYVLNFDGFRVYISGDTEDIPEMRALEDIGLCFVCMNLPFTMTAEQAASAVSEFRPRFVYPYHYRGREGGTQDPQAFAEMVGEAAEVKLHDWYG
jgi:L-ascorbate metabolism protein UlaG (beta-lactamase superfamily)